MYVCNVDMYMCMYARNDSIACMYACVRVCMQVRHVTLRVSHGWNKRAPHEWRENVAMLSISCCEECGQGMGFLA